jgi:hypothetical protein
MVSVPASRAAMNMESITKNQHSVPDDVRYILRGVLRYIMTINFHNDIILLQACSLGSGH